MEEMFNICNVKKCIIEFELIVIIICFLRMGKGWGFWYYMYYMYVDVGNLLIN